MTFVVGWPLLKKLGLATLYSDFMAMPRLYMEQRRMEKAAEQSEWVEARLKYDENKPLFDTGQSVLHFWSRWMEKAEELPKQLKRRGRPTVFLLDARLFLPCQPGPGPQTFQSPSNHQKKSKNNTCIKKNNFPQAGMV